MRSPRRQPTTSSACSAERSGLPHDDDSRHCEERIARRSNPGTTDPSPGLLRCARNDDAAGWRMKLTILGCGASGGVPVLGGPNGEGDWGQCDPKESRNHRMRASVLVQQGNTTLLVDTSPDLRTQCLRFGVGRIDAVLYTHDHA